MRSNKLFWVILCMVCVLLPLQIQAKTDQKRAEAYIKAVKQAQRKVTQFKQALKSRDPTKIKKATLEIQEDPAAIKELNKENTFVKKKFVDTTEAIQQRTIEGIKRRVAKKYGVKPEDVRIKKFTNPSSEVKAGHDWDVTVSVKGKGEIPLKEATGIVHESYFDAVGGQKAYPDSSPKTFAETHHVEVTNTGHGEAYEGGKKYIEKPKEYQVKDPERLSKTIEHKSHLEQEKAAEHRAKGEHAKAEVSRHEQARQYTKQYEKHIKPRVEEMGGKIPKQVKEGTKILQKIGKYDSELGRVYTPADADAALAKLGKHGETMESIIKKGSTLVESGQKLKGVRGKKIAGKVLEEAGGAALILNTAQDIRESIKGKKSWKETGKNAADATSMGLISTGENATQKVMEGVDTDIANTDAQNSELEAHIIQVGLELKKKGVSPKEVTAIMNDMRFGGRNLLKKKLVELKKEGKQVSLPVPNIVKDTGADDTALERGVQGAKNVVEGVYKFGKRAGETVVDIHKDIQDMAKEKMSKDSSINDAQNSELEAHIIQVGLELKKKGVSPKEVTAIMNDMRFGGRNLLKKKVLELKKEGKQVSLPVPNIVKDEGAGDIFVKKVKMGVEAGKTMLDTYKKESVAKAQLEKIKEKLIQKGISPEAAQIAIDRYKDGHKETLRNTVKKLHALEAEKKVKERIEAEKKAAKIRAMAQEKVHKEKAQKAAKEKAEKIRKMLKEKKEKLKAAEKKRQDAWNRLKEKIEVSKQEKAHEKRYTEMSPKEKHEALKRNNNDAWEKLEETLIKDMVLTQKQEKKLAHLSGTIHGAWSGKDKHGWKAKGNFTMHISIIGKVTGRFSGDSSGSFGGFVNASGQMNVKMGGGRISGGRWSGSVRKTDSGTLTGSGSWHAQGYRGGWRGSGR